MADTATHPTRTAGAALETSLRHAHGPADAAAARPAGAVGLAAFDSAAAICRSFDRARRHSALRRTIPPIRQA